MYYLGLVHGLTRLKPVSCHHFHWLTKRTLLKQTHTDTRALRKTTTHTHTHTTCTQPNWKLHELISVPHSRSRTLTSVLEKKSADTLHTCPAPFQHCCCVSSLSEATFVSCPARPCHWPSTPSARRQEVSQCLKQQAARCLRSLVNLWVSCSLLNKAHSWLKRFICTRGLLAKSKHPNPLR